MNAQTDLSTTGSRVRFARRRAGYDHAVDAWRNLFQRSIGARLYYAIESDGRNLTYRNAVTLAEKFAVPGVDAEWLLRGVGPGPALDDDREAPLESPPVPLERISQGARVLRHILDEHGRQPIDEGRRGEAIGIIASLLDRHNVSPNASPQDAAAVISRDVLDYAIWPLTMPRGGRREPIRA